MRFLLQLIILHLSRLEFTQTWPILFVSKFILSDQFKIVSEIILICRYNGHLHYNDSKLKYCISHD